MCEEDFDLLSFAEQQELKRLDNGNSMRLREKAKILGANLHGKTRVLARQQRHAFLPPGAPSIEHLMAIQDAITSAEKEYRFCRWT